VLALLIELRMFDMPPVPPGYPLNVRFWKALAFAGFLWIAGWACYGEWVCLRSLEIERLVGGGTVVVWLAIANLAGMLVYTLAFSVLTAG